MDSLPQREVYSPREIARATGVPVEHVLLALGGRDGFLSHEDAVRFGRELIAERRTPLALFHSNPSVAPSKGLPIALSSTLHAGILAGAIFVATFGLTPTATTLGHAEARPPDMQLVFIATPGPGGGGGGGGRLEKVPAPKALREGRRAVSSPMPQRQPPKPVEPVSAPPEPKPAPINSEPLPTVVAPIVTAPADNRDRVGVLQEARNDQDSHGPGQGGGAGTGKGTGVGEGDGSGVGPGSGGGTGGGPYRPGSGIAPPRLLREVKADYTEQARRAGITGDVVLEIVVRRDGSVGDVRVLKGLGGGLNDRAVQAVRQWRFAPATRLGSPVDVIVEVSVEFKLR
jgi:TonB family protein